MSADNDQHITTREFDGFKDAVVTAIADSSANLHKRLDGFDRRFDNAQKTTNDLLRVAGDHQAKLEEHERRLNGHRHTRKDDPPSADNEPITMKQVKSIVWALGIAGSVIGAIVKGLPMLLKAIQP
jgi:hypothetical protein